MGILCCVAPRAALLGRFWFETCQRQRVAFRKFAFAISNPTISHRPSHFLPVSTAADSAPCTIAISPNNRIRRLVDLIADTRLSASYPA